MYFVYNLREAYCYQVIHVYYCIFGCGKINACMARARRAQAGFRKFS
jgi:hypothetical protein